MVRTLEQGELLYQTPFLRTWFQVSLVKSEIIKKYWIQFREIITFLLFNSCSLNSLYDNAKELFADLQIYKKKSNFEFL